MNKPAAADSAGKRPQCGAKREAHSDREWAAKTGSTDNADSGHQVLASIPYAVMILLKGSIVFANDAAVGLHGAVSMEQLVGRVALDFVHPDDHTGILARRRDGFHEETFKHKRLRIDGSEFISRTLSSELLWEGERSTLIVIRDITQRSIVRNALEESVLEMNSGR